MCVVRLRENDGGARIFTLVYRKYIQSLGWSISLYPEIKIQTEECNALPHLDYFRALFEWFADNLHKGEANLLEQCRQCLTHGVLLTLRYAIEATDWPALLKNDNSAEMRGLLKSFLSRLTPCSQLCLSVLQSQDVNVGISDDEGSNDEEVSMGSDAQLLMTGTWLTIKELSVVLGTMAQHLPIKDVGVPDGGFLLDLSDFQTMQVYFLETLVKLKHNGAVDKTAASFQELSSRLLHCHLLEYRDLPRSWVNALLDRAKMPHQGRDDIIRRSGGLPFALAAIFRAEPKNVPKSLLPCALDSVIQLISQPDLHSPWTRIHAFHILRHIFNDKALATDAASVLAEGLRLSLNAMSDAFWEVRSAASLCFATLVTRMVGYKNAIGNGANQKSISAFEFFSRYPSGMEYMIDELDGVAERMQSTTKPVPVSLGPILLLLARLMPSATPPVKTTPSQQPALLLPSIQRCLSVVHMPVRQLAARAIVPLVVQGDVLKHVHHFMDLVLTDLRSVPVDNNAAHGHLLAIATLLAAHTDLIHADMESSLWDPLSDLAEMLLDSRVRSAVKLEFLKLTATLKAQNPALAHIKQTVLRDCTVLLGQDQCSPEVMHPLLLQNCASFVLSESQKPLCVDLLIGCLTHRVYEVRLETLRHLYRRLSKGHAPVEQSWIRQQLRQRLHRETHAKCVGKCLKALSAIDGCLHEEAGRSDLWEVLSRLHREEGLIKTRQYALICLGSLIGSYHSSAEMHATSEGDFALKLAVFTGFLETASDYRCPVSLRRSAIDALTRSALLKIDPNSVSTSVSANLLSLWSLLFVFLVDDAVSVREGASALVQEITDSGSSVLSRNASSVEREAFQYMAKAFDGQEIYLHYLLGIISDGSPLELSPDAFSSRVRRLFDKDPDNQQQEILFKCQLAAHQAMHQLERHHRAEGLTEWADALLQSFSDSIQKCREAEKALCWKGQMTNHERIYLWFYRALLGIWIFSSATDTPLDTIQTCEAALLDCQELPIHPDLHAFSELILQDLRNEPLSATSLFDALFLLHDGRNDDSPTPSHRYSRLS